MMHAVSTIRLTRCTSSNIRAAILVTCVPAAFRHEIYMLGNSVLSLHEASSTGVQYLLPLQASFALQLPSQQVVQQAAIANCSHNVEL